MVYYDEIIEIEDIEYSTNSIINITSSFGVASSMEFISSKE